MPSKSDRKATEKAITQKAKKQQLTLVDCPESDELEIKKQTTKTEPAKKIRFPKKRIDQLQMMPDEFKEVQLAIQEYKHEQREVEVFADSLESRVGYDSLLRIMSKCFGSRVAYLRSEAGGSLSLEEARKADYRRNMTGKEAIELLDQMMRYSSERLTFMELKKLNDYSPAAAEKYVGNDQARSPK